MNGADLLRLRAVEESRGLARVWDLLCSQRAGLTAAQEANLGNKYRHHRRELADLTVTAESKTWDDLTRVTTRVDAFEREAFCYALGRLMRAGAAGGLDAWPAADRLLRGLANRTGIAAAPLTGLEFELEWERLEPLLELVRMRYPGTGFWDLPIMAHEFGHYILTLPPAVDPLTFQPLRDDVASMAAQLKTSAPWRSRFAESENQCEQRVKELVADIFATYAVGPAYPQCCIALRIPPNEPDRLYPQHPPWRYRVYAMVETLRVMSAQSADGGYLGVVANNVERLWSEVAGGSRAKPEEVVQEWVAQISGSLKEFSDLRYDKGWLAGQILDLNFEPDKDPNSGCTVAHVLNAGWKWRLAHPDRTLGEIEHAERVLLDYCDRME